MRRLDKRQRDYLKKYKIPARQKILSRSQCSPDDGTRPVSMRFNALPRTLGRVQWGYKPPYKSNRDKGHCL